MPGVVQRNQCLTGAVGGIGQHLPPPALPGLFLPGRFLPGRFLPGRFLPGRFLPGRLIVLVEQHVDADCSIGVVRARGRGERGVGDDPGVGLGHDVGGVAVLAAGPGFVGVPGVGVHGGDHPVWGDPAGGPPPAVGAVRAVGGFDVRSGDQGQQRHRVRGRRVQLLLG